MKIQNIYSFASLDGLICFMLFVLITSCSERTIQPDDNRLRLEYYPLEVGQFRIYDVDEILYSISSFDTLRYELRESIAGSFENLEGKLSYTIHREKRPSAESEWRLDSVWTTRKSSSTLVSVENNVPIIKMVFPIENDLKWNSNELNSLNEKLFSYDLNAEDITLSDQIFTDLIKVTQSEIEENIVNRDERFEVYAPNIGLVWKSGITLTFCTVDCPVQKTIVSGRFINQTLKSYGQR